MRRLRRRASEENAIELPQPVRRAPDSEPAAAPEERGQVVSEDPQYLKVPIDPLIHEMLGV